MDIKKLEVGKKVQGRTSGKIYFIEDYKPAEDKELQQWKINGGWFGYAGLEARFKLYKGALTGVEPEKPKGPGRGNALRKKKLDAQAAAKESTE